jgi:hypothetical protein
MKKLVIWCVTGVAVLMGALLLFAGVQVKDTAGGLFIGLNASDLIGFHGATPVTQAVVNAAATTNSPATVYSYAITAAAPVTNVTVTSQTISLTDTNGVTALVVTNVTLTVQTGTVPTLTTPTTNTLSGSDGVLLNQIRAALVGKGLVQ